MKKIAMIILNITIFIIFYGNVSTNACELESNLDTNSICKSKSSMTASLKGFNVTDLEYVYDKTHDSITLAGSKWEYGAVSMWDAVYRKKYEDSMVYFVLVQTKVSSNINSLNNGYYRMVNNYMNLDVTASLSSGEKLNLVQYSPQPGSFGENSSSSDDSYSFGIGLGSNGIETTTKFSWGVQTTTNYSINNIDYISSTAKPGNAYLTLNFVKQSDKKLNNSYPYRGDFFLNSVFVYELENYQDNDRDIIFDISYEGAIRKYACTVFGCNGCESLSGNISDKISI